MPPARAADPTTARLAWAAQTAVLLGLVWMALDGLANPVPGIAFALGGAALGAWLVPGQPYPWRPLRVALFGGYFLYESLRGGVDVAWRALHPRLPLAPETFDYPLWLPEGMPRTVMVSTVSLLPGTLSVDVDDAGLLRVHALVPGSASGLDTLQRRVAHLFSLAPPEREGGE